MDYQKKNFQYGQKVRVYKSNNLMEGVEGTITGIASIGWFDVYIVSLNEPKTVDSTIRPTFSTFTMPETMLTAV